MNDRQIPALFRPRAIRDSEITITNTKTKYAYLALVDFDRIGVQDVNLRSNGSLRDCIKVKVSKA
jgi:hypothetical protein